MHSLKILIVSSNLDHVELLNKRIHDEIEREGYHNLVTETKYGIVQSITIFRNIKNEKFLLTLLNGYEYLNESTLYFGKVTKLEKYLATEYTSSPKRIRVTADNNEIYDVPLIAEEHIGIKI